MAIIIRRAPKTMTIVSISFRRMKEIAWLLIFLIEARSWMLRLRCVLSLPAISNKERSSKQRLCKLSQAKLEQEAQGSGLLRRRRRAALGAELGARSTLKIEVHHCLSLQGFYCIL